MNTNLPVVPIGGTIEVGGVTFTRIGSDPFGDGRSEYAEYMTSVIAAGQAEEAARLRAEIRERMPAATSEPMTMPEAAPRRSVSQFESYTRCGEAYRLERVEKVPRAPAAWFAQGVAAHAAIEWWEKNGRPIDGEALAELTRKKYDGLIAADREREPDLNRWLCGGNIKPENDIAKRREAAGNAVALYVYEARQADWRVIESEYAFDMDLDGVRVVGYIDQIIEWPNGEITPRDLKTGTKKPAWPLQLRVYGLAIERRIGKAPTRGEFFMLRDGEMIPWDIPGNISPEALGRWFKALEAGVRGRVYLPNPGDGCRVCGVRDYCAAVGGVRADGPETAP